MCDIKIVKSLEQSYNSINDTIIENGYKIPIGFGIMWVGGFKQAEKTLEIIIENTTDTELEKYASDIYIEIQKLRYYIEDKLY